MGLEDTLYRLWGYEAIQAILYTLYRLYTLYSMLYTGYTGYEAMIQLLVRPGQTCSRAGKICHVQIHQILHLALFPGQCAPDSVLHMSKATSCNSTWAVQVWTQSAKIYVLVVTSPSPLCHSQIPSGWALQNPRNPLVWDKSKSSNKATHILGVAGCPSSLSSFPTGKTWGSGEASLCTATLVWGRDTVVNVKLHLSPFQCSLSSSLSCRMLLTLPSML